MPRPLQPPSLCGSRDPRSAQRDWSLVYAPLVYVRLMYARLRTMPIFCQVTTVARGPGPSVRWGVSPQPFPPRNSSCRVRPTARRVRSHFARRVHSHFALKTLRALLPLQLFQLSDPWPARRADGMFALVQKWQVCRSCSAGTRLAGRTHRQRLTAMETEQVEHVCNHAVAHLCVPREPVHLY